MEAVKTILTIPYKIGSIADKVGHSVDACQLMLRQPKHCIILNAVLWRWSSQLTENEMSGLTPMALSDFEEIDLTQRLQTVWSLYQEHDQLDWQSPAEIVCKLNLTKLLKDNGPWALLISYRTQPGTPIFCVCIQGQEGEHRFPPYDTRKRIMVNSQNAYKTVTLERASGQIQELNLSEFASAHPNATSLLGPKRDLFKSAGFDTPTWVILRVLRQTNPDIVRLEMHR